MTKPADAARARQIARELDLGVERVAAALALLDEGATVPFIARYRKEATGGLDEQQLRSVEERSDFLRGLWERREAIEKELARQGNLTDALLQKLRDATTRVELEDLYAPFKPKRRTRATIARDRGLGPLADAMWEQREPRPLELARRLVDGERGVPDADAALAGARDICAERLADLAELRSRLRAAHAEHGTLRVSKTKSFKDQVTKFDTYAEFSGRVQGMPSHRVLAIERGESEGVLRAKLDVELERHYRFAASLIPLKPSSPWLEQLQLTVEDALKRLVAPSAEAHCRGELKAAAERTAVEVFARNLHDLLLAPAFGQRPVLGIDPGQRTGCKCAVVSATGELLAHDTIYLVQGEAKQAQGRGLLLRLLRAHGVEAVAVGNGTHGRETEEFVRQVIAGAEADLAAAPICVSVSESGASIYSASEVARREFPDLDLTVRGAISIARRLQDPLAELVKLDPKSIGVGQYQHDVDPGLLASKLAEVVETCVNLVGVQLNSASAELLASVAGIGPKTAANIVAHRSAKGRFDNRRQLLEVKGLGPRAFEQAAGFLRVRGGSHPLDASAVHPERYPLVERMAKDLGVPLQALIGDRELVQRIELQRYRGEAGQAQVDGGVGDFTLADIVEELLKPGRDPRSSFEAANFREGVSRLEDLEAGMDLEGVVTNVTAFGAFVDVGVHQDGLVHVSQLSDRFVKDPADVVHVGQRIRVRVLEVDLQRKRISLSAKAAGPA